MRRKSHGHHNHKGSRRRFRSDNNAAKIKNAAASRDKYLNMAREALSGGDRIEAENYLQHADHFYRVWAALTEEDNRYRAEREQQQAQANAANGQGAESNAEDMEDDLMDDAEEETAADAVAAEPRREEELLAAV